MDKSLLKSCRYYKGEPSNPYEGKDPNKAMLWSYEQMWVRDAERGLSPADSGTLEDYEAYGLKSFNADDGVPISLKAFLFNRFMHWQGATVWKPTGKGSNASIVGSTWVNKKRGLCALFSFVVT